MIEEGKQMVSLGCQEKTLGPRERLRAARLSSRGSEPEVRLSPQGEGAEDQGRLLAGSDS